MTTGPPEGAAPLGSNGRTEDRQEDHIPELVEYYNDDELKYKEMKSTDIKKIGGRTVPLIVSMDDIEESKVTYLEIDEDTIEYDVPLDDKIFSERNLKK